jgi:hypothetical protein
MKLELPGSTLTTGNTVFVSGKSFCIKEREVGFPTKRGSGSAGKYNVTLKKGGVIVAEYNGVKVGFGAAIEFDEI